MPVADAAKWAASPALATAVHSMTCCCDGAAEAPVSWTLVARHANGASAHADDDGVVVVVVALVAVAKRRPVSSGYFGYAEHGVGCVE